MSKLAKALTAAAGNAGGDNLYVEDVFSTYLYIGNSANQNIVNGIDLAGEGGMVWTKRRDNSQLHGLFDTERGVLKYISSDSTDAETTKSNTLKAFNSDGFQLGYQSYPTSNSNGEKGVSWTFRKAEKFFDIVTWTGNGDGSDRYYNHDLGSVPNCVIVKRTDASMDWGVYHSQLGTGGGSGLKLNTTDAIGSPNPIRTTPSSTQIHIRGSSGEYNENNATYVAYLFASDAGGFGDDGSENIIKCGSYTGNGSADGPTIDCGFEPQWLLIKNTSSGGNWVLMDAMRGMPVGDEATVLLPNANGAESSYANLWGVDLQATGFKVNVSQIQINESGGTMVYIAIRRPMKTPESGTEVFDTILRTGTGSNATITGMGFTPDLAITKIRAIDYPQWAARLTNNKYLKSSITDAETTGDLQSNAWDVQEGLKVYSGGFNSNGDSFANWFFKRATGFFDVVAYTGDGQTTQTLNHNLGVTPDIIVVKKRSTSGSQWPIIITSTTDTMYLNTTNASFGAFYYIDNPTSTTFDVQTDGSAPQSNQSGETYIAYLFATLAGVSKVGSYTGTGTTNNIDCGFGSSARFVMVKRTSSTGDWYVWDSARGITVGIDPFLKINTTDPEGSPSSDIIQPYSSGFTLTNNAGTAINGAGSAFIFLAIA